ncbi:MAG: transglutaminase domain-containing protein [Acidimicrobiia bacterium]|nr:transglutaminase domain-containing protein [Acidimicrobiia bacterium]
MTLLGSTSAAALRTTARVDELFRLRSFDFSLDPGTGAVQVSGTVQSPAEGAAGPHRLTVTITSTTGTRTEERDLEDAPVLSLNLSRQLASGGFTPGAKLRRMVLDPATLRNAPMDIEVGARQVIRVGDAVVPAFRVDMELSGLRTTSWITDTGEVVREESPLGLLSVREDPERAQGLAVPGRIQADLLQTSAVVPETRVRIEDPRAVRRIRLQLQGAEYLFSSPDLQGAGQRASDNVIEIVDPRTLTAGPADPEAAEFLAAEPLIESDAPEIVAEARLAVQGVQGTRARAERLTRYVNALLEKKPTVSLPSAREVLRTKVGDCNEHTALYVAMARSLGIPARIAVGLVYVLGAQGAFYYHAWPEVYIDEGNGRGLWLPVDPTLNEFPADATHVRLARGGLDKQAVIVPLIGQVEMAILELDQDPAATPILVGREQVGLPPIAPNVARTNDPCRCDQ